MGIRFIYGKSGTGKSQFILDEIKNRIDKENKIYIITPEQFTFTLEKKLLNIIGRESVVNTEVISFGRMAYRIIRRNWWRNKTKAY